MAEMKSKRQVAYLLSSGSPLTASQKDKLKKELHSGTVKVKKTRAARKVHKARKKRKR